MSQSRREIVDEACLLVAQLSNGRVAVKRTFWSSILADFMASPGTDAAMARRQLQELMRQLKKGNGGHLNRNPQEYLLAVEVIEQVLADESRSLEELRLLFGWTGRLLHAGRSPNRPAPRPPAMKTPSGIGGGLDSNGVLQALKDKYKNQNRR